MSWTTRLSRGAAALALSFTALGAYAGPYSNMYVFGDSLSDSGNDLQLFAAPDPAKSLQAADLPASSYYTDGTNTGRFTNGLNYADRLADSFGLTLTPSTPPIGGNNYAHGGARSQYVRGDVALYGALSFNQQIDSYLTRSGGVADPNALYVLWIGANDMADALGLWLLNGGTAASLNIISDEAEQTVRDIVTAFVTLQTLGAKNFLIGNSPDLSLTPLARETAAMVAANVIAATAGDPANEPFIAQSILNVFRGASVGFNTALAATLPGYAAPTTSVTYFDAFALQTAITANPAAYGLTNVTSACYDGQVDGSPTPGTSAVSECPNESEYLYYDLEHPSAVLHDWAARTMYAQLVVPEPGELALSLTALGLMGFFGRRRSRA